MHRHRNSTAGKMATRRTTHQRRKRIVLTVRLRWLALLVAGGLGVWWALVSIGGNPAGSLPASPAVTSGSVASATRSSLSHFFDAHLGRVLYPYSVIPGGIRSVAELRRAISRDPVVALHYASFNLQRARLIRLRHARLAYVSYRIGNRVYWTKKKLRLARGETVITDGKHIARTRCGNRVSALPEKPVSFQEPSSETLNRPEIPPTLLAYDSSPLSLPDLTPPAPAPIPAPIPAPVSAPPVPGTPLLPSSNQPSGGGPIFLPPGLFFPDGGYTPKTPQPPPPPVSVPEPGTLTLLLAGLPAVWFFHRRRGR